MLIEIEINGWRLLLNNRGNENALAKAAKVILFGLNKQKYYRS